MSLATQLFRWWLDLPFISLRYKKSAYRHLSRRSENRDIPFVCDFYGLRYEGNLQNGIEFAIYYYGAFEKPLLFFLRDAARVLASNSDEPLCFCDIGSNVGQHALFMSQNAEIIHAFEPYQAVRDRLLHHIGINNLGNITVHPVGLGASDAELNFYAPTGSNQGIGSFIAKGEEKTDSRVTDIGKLKVVQADRYFAEQQIPKPQLVKIDVEGFERSVLQGMRSLLEECRPVLVCEITYDEEQSFSSLAEIQLALPADYALYHFDIRKPDGQTDRRRGSRAKRTGSYRLSPMQAWRVDGQDDVVAIPTELLGKIPLSNP